MSFGDLFKGLALKTKTIVVNARSRRNRVGPFHRRDNRGPSLRNIFRSFEWTRKISKAYFTIKQSQHSSGRNEELQISQVHPKTIGWTLRKGEIEFVHLRDVWTTPTIWIPLQNVFAEDFGSSMNRICCRQISVQRASAKAKTRIRCTPTMLCSGRK